MLDPIPPASRWLREWTTPWAESLSLPSLPYHSHEVILAFAFYQFVQSVASPHLSAWLFPNIYPNFNKRTKLNWDIHVVSLVQSTLICAMAFWVMYVDEERKSMTASERVYGYSGGCGLIQAMAAGYFVWDLIISTRYLSIFGVGLWFHAVSALWVFSLGFRPFVNYYAPTFILYELSSPFLNFHWFFDKVNMTGSRAQWYNGMALLSVFFCCRLVWGSWQSVRVFSDIFHAFQQSRPANTSLEPFDIHSTVFGSRNPTLCTSDHCVEANAEVSRFAHYTAEGIPLWLVITYLGSNLILNSLNFFWFGKMVETVLKRFKTPDSSAEKKEITIKSVEEEANAIVLEAAATLEEEESIFINGGIKDDAVDGKPIATGRANGPGGRRRKA